MFACVGSNQNLKDLKDEGPEHFAHIREIEVLGARFEKLRFWGPDSRNRGLGAQIRGIEVLGPRFEKSRFHFGSFRYAPTKSKTTFTNQLSILFHIYGLRFYVRSS